MQEGDVDLSFVAAICRENPDLFAENKNGLFHGKYSCAYIIELADRQADFNRQKGQN